MGIVEEVSRPYDKLKNILDNKNLNQSVVAEELGIDRSTFNLKLNRSKGRDFTMSEAFKISKLIGVNIDDFF